MQSGRPMRGCIGQGQPPERRRRRRRPTCGSGTWLSTPCSRAAPLLPAVVSGLKYAEDHEWVKVEGDVATIGITDHAQVWSGAWAVHSLRTGLRHHALAWQQGRLLSMHAENVCRRWAQPWCRCRSSINRIVRSRPYAAAPLHTLAAPHPPSRRASWATWCTRSCPRLAPPPPRASAWPLWSRSRWVLPAGGCWRVLAVAPRGICASPAGHPGGAAAGPDQAAVESTRKHGRLPPEHPARSHHAAPAAPIRPPLTLWPPSAARCWR